ncbi:MAG: thioredoxin family protein [Saprospiraceae bacterium]|nr:thioredoxin family protein [Saprospiraceae bacterium]
MAQQVEAGATSGPIQNEKLSKFTHLNESRMSRLDRKLKLLPAVEERLKMVRQPQNWLVITETWCGDAAQILGVLNKMAETNDAIQMKLIFRDENIVLMENHLTKGARAIPKLICLNEDMSEILGEWGPRPRKAQETREKSMATVPKKSSAEEQKAIKEEIQITLQKWYNSDKGESTQLEMLVEIEKWQM